MRNIFIEGLITKAKKNKNIILITGDLGYKYFDKFNDLFPNRFINAGIAENNMVNLASGLALMGKEVYVYSIIPFLTFRSLEQIRNNICNLNLNVKIIGSGGGFSYGNQGISHNPIEDIAVMRALPNIRIYNPGFEDEGKITLKHLFNNKKPAYVRLGKKANFAPKKNLHKNYTEGDGYEVFKGKKILIIATGNIIDEINSLRNYLNKHDISPTIVSCFCLKPINENFYIKLIKRHQITITVEEHSEIGGLSSIISDIISKEINLKTLFYKFALKDKAHLEIGSQNYLKSRNGIDGLSLYKKIIRLIKD